MTTLEVAWVPVEGIWVRQTAGGVGGAEALPSDARWQTPSRPAAYFGDSEDTVWAGFYRALAERGIRPNEALPRDVHRVRVSLERVADLSMERARRALGVPRMRPTSAQWPAFQPVGERLAEEGALGILYSSSARTRSLCLCVFEAGLSGVSIEGTPVRVVAPCAPPRGMRT